MTNKCSTHSIHHQWNVIHLVLWNFLTHRTEFAEKRSFSSQAIWFIALLTLYFILMRDSKEKKIERKAKETKCHRAITYDRSFVARFFGQKSDYFVVNELKKWPKNFSQFLFVFNDNLFAFQTGHLNGVNRVIVNVDVMK